MRALVLLAAVTLLAAGALAFRPPEPLPQGLVVAAAPSVCPPGSSTTSACMRLVVECPSASPAAAILRVSDPSLDVPRRGTLVTASGAEGTTFTAELSPRAASMLAAIQLLGLVVVEVRWESPGVWGGPQARTLGCRFATAIAWIHDHLHDGRRTRLFAAHGVSGGASQIAFALAHYQLSEMLDLALLSGGPPGCPRCAKDGQHFPEPLLPGQPAAVSREPLLNYPATAVRFFLGELEPNEVIVREARAYYEAISSEKSLVIVREAPHAVEQTDEGVDAILSALRAAFK